jgi:hypothetical protein
MMATLKTFAPARNRDFTSAFMAASPIAVPNGHRRINDAMAQSPESLVPSSTYFQVLGCGQFALFNRDPILAAGHRQQSGIKMHWLLR